MHTFRDGDDTAPILVEDGLDVRGEDIHVETTLREINQVRAVVMVFARQGGGGSQKARVPAHDDANIDAWQRAIIEVYPGESGGHELGSRWKSRRMVVDHQIVIDGFRDMHAAKAIVGLLRLVCEDTQRIGRIVAADIKERADAMRLQDLENFLAIGEVGLVASRAERRAWRGCDLLQVDVRFLSQIDHGLIDDTADAMQCPVYASGIPAPRFLHSADQGLVNDRRRTATLRDQHFPLQHACPS